MEKMEMLRQLTEQIDMEKVQDLYRRFKAGEINQADYEAQVRSLVETVGAKVTGRTDAGNDANGYHIGTATWRRTR